MNKVLARVIFRLDAIKKSMLKDRVQRIEHLDSVDAEIAALKNVREQEVANMETILTEETKNISDKLFTYLSSEEFVKKFTTWETKNDIPPDEDSWKSMKATIKKTLGRRLQIFLTGWEEQCQIHAKAYAKIVQCFEERYVFLRYFSIVGLSNQHFLQVRKV